MMAFIGVRISWLMLARKVLRAAAAASAFSLACSKASDRVRLAVMSVSSWVMRKVLPQASRMGLKVVCTHSSSPCLTRAWHSRLAKSPR